MSLKEGMYSGFGGSTPADFTCSTMNSRGFSSASIRISGSVGASISIVFLFLIGERDLLLGAFFLVDTNTAGTS